MIELKLEHDYVVCDTEEWVEDRTDGEHAEATEAWEMWREANPDGYESEALITWLKTLDATGIYGESGPMQVCTVNEENFLSGDFILTFANTEAYGTLFITQPGYFMSGNPTIYTFNGDDDSDAFGWASGWARCDCEIGWHEGGCDAEWIIESACKLWQNGGGQTERICDVLQVSEVTGNTYAVCPRCGYGNLTFWAS